MDHLTKQFLIDDDNLHRKNFRNPDNFEIWKLFFPILKYNKKPHTTHKFAQQFSQFRFGGIVQDQTLATLLDFKLRASFKDWSWRDVAV
jgi:hypothetical protein